MITTKCLFLSWEEIEKVAAQVAAKIKKSSFRPAWVVAIARGGVVPARLFCDLLHLKNLAVVKVDHWGVTAAPDGRARLSYGANVNLRGKKVLLVDDVTDTGESMQLACDYLKSQGVREIKTAILYHLTGSAYLPDFFGVEREWAWLIFPWNRREDLVNLINKLGEKEKRRAEPRLLAERMRQAYTLEITSQELEDVLAHMEELSL